MHLTSNYEPIPPRLHEQLRVMRHDLFKVRENLAVGRVKPEHYADLERVLGARLELLEAEIHGRLLDEARRKNAKFRMT